MCFLEPPPSPPTEHPLGVSCSFPAALLHTAGYLLWRDIGRFWAQWLVMFSLAAMFFWVRVHCDTNENAYLLRAISPLQAEYGLAAPGCPAGYSGPGGLAQEGALLGSGCTGEKPERQRAGRVSERQSSPVLQVARTGLST